MTVQELIKKLEMYEPDTPVVVGQEDGPKGEIVDIRPFYGSVNNFANGYPLPGYDAQSILKIVCGIDRQIKNELVGNKHRYKGYARAMVKICQCDD